MQPHVIPNHSEEPMRRLVLVVSVVWLPEILGACDRTGARASGEWDAAVDTVGDTVVVRTLTGSAQGDTARLVPEMRIGELEGPDHYILGNVSGWR